MFDISIRSLMIGGKAAALATLMATTAPAQTTIIETPEGNTAILPDAVLEEEPGADFVRASDYPILERFENNEVVAETLLAQGFTDIRIERVGPIMTVTAQRDGEPIELVYSTANGRLVSVDGVETRDPPEGSSREDETTSEDGAGEDPGEDGDENGDDAGDGDADLGDDGTGDDGGDPGGDDGGDGENGDSDAGDGDGGGESDGGDGDGDGGEGGDGES